MSLQVWLPLNGNLENKGLSDYNITIARGNEIYDNNGKIGKCFHSNGVNTIKILNIIPDFYNYTGYSLSAWFYIETNNTTHSGSGIISAGNWNRQLLNMALSDWSSDHYTKIRISGTRWEHSYNYNFMKNIWYHVVISSDGEKTCAYVNGELVGDTEPGFLPTSIEGNDIYIGGATYYSGMQFFGKINDVRIYNHALSIKEVKEISKGLILHYLFSDINNLGYDNNIIYDCSGYQNNGILNNINYSNETVKYNSSVLFNGDTSYISISSSILNNLFTGTINPFSFTFWIYHKDTTRAVLFGDYGLIDAIGFNIELKTDHCLRFYWNGNPDYHAINSSVKLNTWSFVSIIYNGTQILFYINGKLTDSYIGTLSLKNKISGDFYLGRDSRTGNTALNGNLSDFRIYTTALSAEDIKELYITSASIDKDANFYTYQYKEIQNEKFSIKSNNIVNSYQIQQKFYNLGLITTSVSIASFPDGADNVPMKDVKVQIEPVQDLNGYDSPWPAGSGKNLIENNVQSGTHSSGITVTRNNDGSLTLNGTITNSTVIIGNFATGLYGAGSIQNDEKKHVPNGQYIINTGLSSGVGLSLQICGSNTSGVRDVTTIKSVGTTTTFTIDDTYAYNWVRLTLGSGTYNNVLIKPTICLASETDTSYSPYSNICPITGWTGVNVSRTGKNMLNGVYTNEFVNADGSIGTDQSSRLSDYIYVGDNAFCISAKHIDGAVVNGLRCGGYDENKKFIQRALVNVSGGTAIVTRNSFGTDKNSIKYIRPNLFINSEDINTWMTEYGTEPSEYVFPGTLYPITFPTEAGTVYGGTLDITTGELVVDRAMVEITECIAVATTSTGVQTASATLDPLPIEESTKALSNIYKLQIASPPSTSGWFRITQKLYIYDNRFVDKTVANNILSVERPQFVYPLATPIIYQLSPTEITSLLGTNNLWADTGDIKNLIYCKNNNTVSIQRNGTIQTNSFIEI